MKAIEQKVLLRKNMLNQRLSLTEEEIKEKSLRLTENLISSGLTDNIKSCMAFVPFRNEIDTTYIIKKLLARRVQVALPRVNKEQNTITAYVVANLSDNLETGVWGIKEPLLSLPVVPPGSLDLILVPGIAFDKNHYRLGYGGGFYDRFLKETRAITIGVCYDFQVIEQVPTEAWDKQLQKVVSEKGWY